MSSDENFFEPENEDVAAGRPAAWPGAKQQLARLKHTKPNSLIRTQA